MANGSESRRGSDLPWIGVFIALCVFLVFALSYGLKI
jgi:hypothetical protein